VDKAGGRKRKSLEDKEVKRPIPEDKGVLSLLSGRYTPAVAFLLIAVTALFTAYNRNLVWKDDTTLWEDVVEKSPGKVRGHYSLGTSYDKKGRMEEAISKYKEALRLNPEGIQRGHKAKPRACKGPLQPWECL
jgi:tetratricopeptide (TPR) repeat protein